MRAGAPVGMSLDLGYLATEQSELRKLPKQSAESGLETLQRGVAEEAVDSLLGIQDVRWQLEDLALLAFAVNRFIDAAPASLRAEHQARLNRSSAGHAITY